MRKGPHEFLAFKVFVKGEEEDEQRYIQNEDILREKTNAILFAAASTGSIFNSSFIHSDSLFAYD
jgi:hypothetical protein